MICPLCSDKGYYVAGPDSWPDFRSCEKCPAGAEHAKRIKTADTYHRIKDRGGLGWLHLPTQATFERMQEKRNAKKDQS